MEIQNLINVVCIVGIGYCLAKMAFLQVPYHIIKLHGISEDRQIVTVKRLWKIYEYETGDDIHIHDINNNIEIDLILDR